MPSLRFDRLVTWTCLILLLISSRAALADPIADADKPLPNVETGNPPAEVHSMPTPEKSAGSDPETTPVPLRGSVPAASETAGDSTERNTTTVEPSEQTGGLMPAPVPGPLPTGTTDRPVTDSAEAAVQTPTPPAATTSNANQPVVESSPPVAATPGAASPKSGPAGACSSSCGHTSIHTNIQFSATSRGVLSGRRSNTSTARASGCSDHRARTSDCSGGAIR